MKISFFTTPSNLQVMNGYGRAGYGMLVALKELGHEVPFRDSTAPVEIAFNQPEWTTWSNPDAYHIQYTPWESTGLPEGWVDLFNTNCDEVWTPSPLIAQWYENAGVTTPIRVFQHGIDHDWSPSRVPVETSRFTFLHHGEPAPRKGGQMVIDAFLDLFGGSKDHLLIIKADRRFNLDLIGDEKNIKVMKNQMEEPELINLYRSVNCNVYPSYGEGFGLIPLQSLGTGTPTICTGAWAPYSDFLLPDLSLASKMVDSPWPDMHPGYMFEPSYDNLLYSMQFAVDNETKVTSQSRSNSIDLHRAYDWKRLTESAFAGVVQRFG